MQNILKQSLQFEADMIEKDSETGFLKICNYCYSPDFGQKIYFTDPVSEKKSDVYDMASDFCNGLAAVGIKGKGCGYINTDFEFVVKPVYDNVFSFCGGFAKAVKDDETQFIDSKGNTLFDPKNLTNNKYTDIEDFSEGLCRVSTMGISEKELVRRSKNGGLAGIWGYINQNGEEAVKPQFVYAEDFLNSFAIVAKGSWKFDSENYDYVAKNIRWGVIDKNGSEIIPFEFIEIKRMLSDKSMFAVCDDNGRWGVADSYGSITFEPVFETVCDCYNGLIVFSNDREKAEHYDYELYGIYDLNRKEILFDSQFYKVSFEEDGLIKVAVFDKKLDRTVEKIIDRSGKELFKSNYTYIAAFEQPYKVAIRENGEEAQGLIDKSGNVIFPLTQGIAINGLHYDKRRIVFDDEGQKYMCDFDCNRLTERTYNSISGFENEFLTVAVTEKGRKLHGIIDLDGKTVLEPIYDRVIIFDDNFGFAAICGRKAEIFKSEQQAKT